MTSLFRPSNYPARRLRPPVVSTPSHGEYDDDETRPVAIATPENGSSEVCRLDSGDMRVSGDMIGRWLCHKTIKQSQQ
jgi:hypothetical protein